MIIKEAPAFTKWLGSLRDVNAYARIVRRIERLRQGNPGHVNDVGHGVSELKIDYGPGYRVYFVQRGPVLILLLCGGDKSSQRRDIKRAIEIAAYWSE
jgi:putative addiction module killer protein